MTITQKPLKTDFPLAAIELALSQTGFGFPSLTQFKTLSAEANSKFSSANAKSPSILPLSVITPSINGLSYFILDVTVTPTGDICLIEANGSNAALTSCTEGRDDERVSHMNLAFESKVKSNEPSVILLPHQSSLLHIAEFYHRAGSFAKRVAERYDTELCSTDAELGREEISIVCGPIHKVADYVSAKEGQLFFKNRPVVFACNPNLLPELARRDIIRRQGSQYNIDTSFYHEGCCTHLVHDKGEQQNIAQGTGFKPLYYKEAGSVEECLAVIKEFHSHELVAVGKMNAGSGGAGIEFFPPHFSKDETNKRLKILIDSVTEKYGIESSKTIFPIRFFEFARSTDYDIYGKGHLWDLRLQCLIYPGCVKVIPCIIRICPEPFDEKSFSRDSVVSNLTGRDGSTVARFMRSPTAMRKSQPCSVLDAVGIDALKLKEIMQSCTRWCEAAWKASLKFR